MRALILASLFLAILPVAASFSAASARPTTGGLAVSRRELSAKDAVADIRVAYPATGNARIDTDLAATANDIARNFRAAAMASHDKSEPPYTLDVRYFIARNDRRMFAVEFDDEWDFHGAHPNLEIVTANYFRQDGWRVYLPELFAGAPALDRISHLAIEALDRQLLKANPLSDSGWIARGADPHWDNFAAFLLLPGRLTILFPPYAVASYAAGPQKISLPLAQLRHLLRRDPRAPVPSFDCARAKDAVEHAICRDVALARLDRQEVETWSSQYRNEDDPKRRAALLAEQRAWLAARSKSCPSGTGRTACLIDVYQARLAKLARPG